MNSAESNNLPFRWLLGFFFIQEDMKLSEPTHGAAVWGAFFTALNVYTIIRIGDIMLQNLDGFEGIALKIYSIIGFVSLFIMGFTFDAKLRACQKYISTKFNHNERKRAKLYSLIYVALSFTGFIFSIVIAL